MRPRLSQRGQTTVEFALVLPALFLFLFGVFQVGGAYFNKEALQTSARDGARAASIHSGDTWANIQADAIAAVKANATGLTWSNVTTSVTCSTATCGTGDVVTVTLSSRGSSGSTASRRAARSAPPRSSAWSEPRHAPSGQESTCAKKVIETDALCR